MSGLFDSLAYPPRDPLVCDVEAVRLSNQTERIVERLREGPATARQLLAIALNYRARISDARKAGYDVRLVKRDYESGKTQYALFVAGREYQPCP
jgi:hypothetical protein